MAHCSARANRIPAAYTRGVQQQQQEPLVIPPTGGSMKFRRGYTWVIFACIVVDALLTLAMWSNGHQEAAFFTLFQVFFMTGLLWWFKRQNKEQRVGDKVAPRPAILLDESGLTVLGSPQIGPIFWEEVGEVKAGSFLGFPIIKLELNYRAVRRRLGARGRLLWSAWVPGGIGLNAMPFGGKGDSAAEQINAYRARLGSGPHHPVE